MARTKNGCHIPDRIVVQGNLKEIDQELNRLSPILEALLSSVRDYLYVFDLQGCFVYANQMLLDLWGLSREEAIGKNMGELHYPKDVESQLMQGAQQVVATKEVFRNETYYVSPTGTRAYYENILAPVFGTAGEVALIAGSSRDITDRKITEQNLRANEERFRTVIENLSEGLIISDLDGKLLHWNRAALDLHGFFCVDDGNRRIAEFVDVFEISTLDGAVLTVDQWPLPRIIRGEQISNWEICIRRLNTTWQRIFKYGGGVVRDAAGSPLLAFLTITDITESKRTEQVLRESQEDLNRAQAVAHTGSWRLNVQRNTLQWSDESYRIFGLPRDVPLTYESFLGTVHLEDRPYVDRRWKAALRGDPYDIEHRIVVGDTVKWVRERAELEFDTHGELLGGFGTTQDITGRRQAEEALKEADQRKDEFLAILGHELRNPLAALSTAINVLKNNPDPERREWGEGIIQRQVQQLQRLVDDLLDVSRITRGKILLQKEILEIGECMKSTARSLKSSLKGRNLWLSPPSQPVFVSADPVRIQQIFTNLLSNAAKYTQNGGEIRFSAEETHGSILVRCRDNGIGIDPDKIPWIFEPFTQVDTELHRGNAGLGIGLALVKNLVEMHDGSISAVSDGPGKGSEFTVTLPVAEHPLKETEPISIQTHTDVVRSGKVRHILIAEDNMDLADSQRILLENAGHKVSVVRDGTAAVAAARKNPPHIMLTDIGLPGLDGYAVAETIRNSPGLEKIILIGISGYQQDRERADSCFDHYFVKPVADKTLLMLIDNGGEVVDRIRQDNRATSKKISRILLIEDHPDLGAATLDLLCDVGYEARLAKDGESGIKTCATFLPHVVLCDLRLPDMNGLDVAQRLRKDNATKSIILIALTASDVATCEPELKAAGFDYAISKPLDLQALREMLRQEFQTH